MVVVGVGRWRGGVKRIKVARGAATTHTGVSSVNSVLSACRVR